MGGNGRAMQPGQQPPMARKAGGDQYSNTMQQGGNMMDNIMKSQSEFPKQIQFSDKLPKMNPFINRTRKDMRY